MYKQRFVLDTTAFTDRGVVDELGDGDLCEAVTKLLDLIGRARMELAISCYIPYPTVYRELKGFLERNGCPELLSRIDTWIVKKTPNRYEVKVPARLFMAYVKDMRERLDRGRKRAEKAIWEAALEAYEIMLREEADVPKERIIREVIGETVRRFRRKYRQTVRHGTLDSAPDLDVLLLAKELDAAVVASDEGIERWARELGLRFMPACSFPGMIDEYLRMSREVEE
ncbi:RNA ligase partner protein [Methanopyrus sp.]